MKENIERVIKNYNKNNMECHYFETRGNLISFLDDFISNKDVVSVGGLKHYLN